MAWTYILMWHGIPFEEWRSRMPRVLSKRLFRRRSVSLIKPLDRWTLSGFKKASPKAALTRRCTPG